MKELTIFKFKERPVRIHRDDNGEPWFCLKDICDTLQIKNNRNVVNRVRNTDVRTMDTGTETGIRSMLFVNEIGLYDAILESRKPEAKEFRYWVTSEVLPSIRKTGSYSVEPLTSTAALKEFARGLTAVVDKIGEIEARMDRYEAKQQSVIAVLEPVKEVSNRARINQVVRDYAFRNKVSYQDCWDKLYYEFKYRYGMDLKQRADHRHTSGVAIAEEMGRDGELLGLAIFLFTK